MTVGGTVRGERIGDGQWTSELPPGLEVCMHVLHVMNIKCCMYICDVYNTCVCVLLSHTCAGNTEQEVLKNTITT